MNERPLILFTHFYPFGDRELFLETEIPYLQEKFSRIIVVPNEIAGPQRPIPLGITVETSFAKTRGGKSLPDLCSKMLRALLYTPVYRELLAAPKEKKHLRKLFAYASEAQRCIRWVRSYLRAHQDLQSALFYTYWFYDHATGLASLKKEFPDITLASRAHGFDLYEEDYYPPYIPFRSATLHAADLLVLISQHGYDYLGGKYPLHSNKMLISRLGIEDPGFTIPTQQNLTLKLVSCSHLVSLKRIHLQIDGIASFARKHPDVPIHWQHAGDGPLKEYLVNYAAQHLPPWVQWSFNGHLSNKDVFTLYRSFQPDLFLLTSRTEGLPVSIMEANSCGIPAIATAVGGIPEIINDSNGLLLPSDPTPGDIAKSLSIAWHTPNKLASMKEAARLHWNSHFNANVNYRHFARVLQQY